MQWKRQYAHRIDRFASEQAFLDFGRAARKIRGIVASSHHKFARFQDERFLERIRVAWAIQWVNTMGHTYLRVYTVLQDDEGLQVYYDTTETDFWTQRSDFVQTQLADYHFKIERVEAS